MAIAVDNAIVVGDEAVCNKFLHVSRCEKGSHRRSQWAFDILRSISVTTVEPLSAVQLQLKVVPDSVVPQSLQTNPVPHGKQVMS